MAIEPALRRCRGQATIGHVAFFDGFADERIELDEAVLRVRHAPGPASR